MSQDLRKQQRDEGDSSQPSMNGSEGKSYEGFEGMNYEQIRQPYNPKHTGRNNNDDERKNSKRPDES